MVNTGKTLCTSVHPIHIWDSMEQQPHTTSTTPNNPIFKSKLPRTCWNHPLGIWAIAPLSTNSLTVSNTDSAFVLRGDREILWIPGKPSKHQGGGHPKHPLTRTNTPTNTCLQNKYHHEDEYFWSYPFSNFNIQVFSPKNAYSQCVPRVIKVEPCTVWL